VSGRPDPLPLASDINGDVDPALAQVIDRALALDSEQRFASASEMRAALQVAVEASAETHSLPAEQDASQLWVPTEPANIAPVSFSEPDRFEGKLEQETIAAAPVSDSTDGERAATASAGAASAAASTRIKPQPTRAPRFFRPFWQRPAFWTAMIVIALTAFGIGYSKYHQASPLDASDHVSSADPAIAAQSSEPETAASDNAETIAAEPPATENEQAPEPEISRVNSKSDEQDDSEPEVSITDPTSEDPVATRTTSAADRTSSRKRTEPKKEDVGREQDREETARPAFPPPTSTRRNRTAAQQQARRNRQQDEFYEPPISSIEMIFTGIPPERRRRRYRRWQPY